MKQQQNHVVTRRQSSGRLQLGAVAECGGFLSRKKSCPVDRRAGSVNSQRPRPRRSRLRLWVD